MDFKNHVDVVLQSVGPCALFIWELTLVCLIIVESENTIFSIFNHINFMLFTEIQYSVPIF